MEMIPTLWVLLYCVCVWDINETMYVNEVLKLQNNLWIPITLILQWPRVSRGGLVMCHIPCETSSWACLRALFYQMMKNLGWADLLVLGPPQGSGVMLLEDFHFSSPSFCRSNIAFSLQMWCLCSISHNMFVTFKDQKTSFQTLTDPTLTPLLMTLKSLSLPLTGIPSAYW